MTTTAKQAIARSVSHNEIVHIDEYDADVAADLLAECEDSTDANDETEYWGTSADGDEWRVHMAREKEVTETTIHDATDGDPDEIVTVETMPDCHRASHRAARNWGVYPMNGAEREEMSRAEADEIIAADPDGYAHIV